MISTAKKFWQQQKNKNLLLVGISPLTGLATSQWLNQQQIKYSVSDLNLASEVAQILNENQKKFNLPRQIFNGAQSLEQLSGITDIILSPGIPRSLSFLQMARQKGIPIWCDFDYFYPLYQNKLIIAVTGTDGKTTTVKLIHHLLQTTQKCYLCGNVGIPFCSDYQKFCDSEVLIIELSSYMLEDLKQFRANISLITNLAPDHLNRYDSFESYVATKKNIYQFAQTDDFFLQNVDDPILQGLNTASKSLAPLAKPQLKTVGQKRQSYSLDKSPDYYFTKDVFFLEGQEFKPDFLPLVGKHNRYNLLFALAVCTILQAQWRLNLIPLLQKRLKSFHPLPHRLEKVILPQTSLLPFAVYNDSKATTLQAVLSAIDSFPANIVLLLGGRGKGLDYRAILGFRKKLKQIFTYGEAGTTIAAQLKEISPIYVPDLAHCIERAWACLQARDVFLFSPGCMSQDQFENYEVRGDFFKKQVLALA